MKQSKWVIASMLALMVAVACETGDSNGPSEETFTATLNGANERPNAITTPAVGTASFTLSADGNTLTWSVVTTGANNVTA